MRHWVISRFTWRIGNIEQRCKHVWTLLLLLQATRLRLLHKEWKDERMDGREKEIYFLACIWKKKLEWIKYHTIPVLIGCFSSRFPFFFVFNLVWFDYALSCSVLESFFFFAFLSFFCVCRIQHRFIRLVHHSSSAVYNWTSVISLFSYLLPLSISSPLWPSILLLFFFLAWSCKVELTYISSSLCFQPTLLSSFSYWTCFWNDWLKLSVPYNVYSQNPPFVFFLTDLFFLAL